MDIYTLDFETFFSAEYSLTKLNTEAYVRDTRFEALCLGVVKNGMQTGALPQEEIAPWLRSIDWSKAAILAHHAQFDGLILSHHYGVIPGLWLDTLAMARQVHGTHVSVALESLAKHYGLSPKTVPYNLFKGKRWNEMDGALKSALMNGAEHDAALEWRIFKEMSKVFPAEEYGVVDMTTRMFTEPVLTADVNQLRDIWIAEERKKQGMLRELGVDASELQSSEKFADLLRAEGVEPGLKANAKGEKIYAFAKSDDFMKELVDNDDETISLLARARLGVKSTIDQTRVETFGDALQRGALPVYLRYCGAHTTRWSGGDGTNWQNFRRGGDLRKAIHAPEGYKIGVADSSQIECRLLNYVAGQHDVTERFRRGEDPYVAGASALYGRTITKEDKAERGTGKQMELSCGYQSGWFTFQKTAKLGIYGPPQIINEAEARRAVDTYRRTHPAVVNLWGEAGRMISRLAGGEPTIWRDVMEVRDGKIYGPNGSWLDYSTLRYDKELQSWIVSKRNGWTKLYGGKLVENVIQWLARIVISQCMLRLKARGFRIVTCTHDEIVALLPADGSEDEKLAVMLEEMNREVPWLPGIPLAAEGGVAVNYSK